MQADIGSPDKYIETNDLKEVTNGNMFGRSLSSPDENGLISYEIFGNPGTKERKKTFAYIDLGDIFVHPLVMTCLMQLKRVIHDIVYGEGLYFVRDGTIVKLTEKNKPVEKTDIGNGCHWLKRNLRKINFEKDGASARVKERISFIKNLKDDEIFIDKWIVIPAYYRDVDFNTRKKNDINLRYQSLISQAKVVKQSIQMIGKGEVTDSHRKIQDKLEEIFTYFTTFIGGTKAFMQRSALGKSIDYSARMVISTAQIASNNPDEMSCDFWHSAVPLSMVLECFDPFIHYGFKQFVRGQIGGSNFIYEKTKNGFVRTPLASHWEECLLKENVQKLIKLYTDSKEHRLDYFTVESEDGRQIPLGYITAESITSTDGEQITTYNSRPITLVEMFYMIAMDTVKDKQIMITRYPIEDYQNIYPSLMNIMPYERTKVMKINGVEYPRFPDITEDDIAHAHDSKIGAMFNDTLHLFPTYLKALGADFDGDTVTVQGVFSKNNPMDYIASPMNMVNISGGAKGTREVTDVITQVIYAMTRNENF